MVRLLGLEWAWKKKAQKESLTITQNPGRV
jgi:hypothetical protein